MYFNQMDIIFLHYPENIFVILSGGKKPSNFSTASLLEEKKKRVGRILTLFIILNNNIILIIVSEMFQFNNSTAVVSLSGKIKQNEVLDGY